MKSHFSPAFFKRNRARLRKSLGTEEPIVLTAYGELQKAQDTTYEFSQDGSFWYLTGLNHPDLLLVMTQKEEYLIVPDLSTSKVFFDGAVVGSELTKVSGVDTVMTVVDGMARLKQLLQTADSVATLLPAPEYFKQLNMYTNPARRRLVSRVKRLRKNLNFTDLRSIMAGMRMIKQPEEIAALQQAIDITCNGVSQLMQKYINGQLQTERDAEIVLHGAFYQNGGDGHGFEPIIAAGDNACTIHPIVSNQPIKDAPLLVDVGAKYQMYNADISRSWSREMSPRYRDIVLSVKDVSDYAMKQLKPGVIMRQYEKDTEQYMGKKLKSLGLIKSLSSAQIRAFFPHATSHFLGIDVHDVGLYDQPLQENVVLTVEPGIYVRDEGIGIRIENDVRITRTGCVNMSGQLADLQPNM